MQLVARRTGETNVVLWDVAGRAQAAIDLVVARPDAGIERELRRVSGNDGSRSSSSRSTNSKSSPRS